MYVAVTRAMDQLFVCATHKEFKKEFKAECDSFFQYFSEGLNIDYSAENFELSGPVKFMINKNGAFEFFDEDKYLKVNLTKNVDYKSSIKKPAKGNIAAKKFLIDKIEDEQQREFVSATKISMYSQCPVKYQLTYDLGYSSIYNMIKLSQNDFEFNNKEDDELKQYANIKGTIIHSILKDEIGKNEINKSINLYLHSETVNDPESFTALKKNIIEDLKWFYESKVYSEINNYKNYNNELEVYCENGDNYLYGIIDKLVYQENKLIVIDYKTDDISIEQIDQRAENYFPQLEFYALILSKLHKNINSFELRLIFIKHPDDTKIKTIGFNELNSYKIQLDRAIENITKRNYKPNLDHCSRCHFALKGDKCVKLF